MGRARAECRAKVVATLDRHDDCQNSLVIFSRLIVRGTSFEVYSGLMETSHTEKPGVDGLRAGRWQKFAGWGAMYGSLIWLFAAWQEQTILLLVVFAISAAVGFRTLTVAAWRDVDSLLVRNVLITHRVPFESIKAVGSSRTGGSAILTTESGKRIKIDASENPLWRGTRSHHVQAWVNSLISGEVESG